MLFACIGGDGPPSILPPRLAASPSLPRHCRSRSLTSLPSNAASPHVAGLAAYFLSLYPEGFDVESQDFTEATYNEILNAPASYLRQGAQIVMGKFTGAARTTVKGSDKPLSPKALKKAMIKLGTKGVLTVRCASPCLLRIAYADPLTTRQDVSADTPNVLIFNNFTTSSALEAMHASVAEFELEQ